VPKAFGLRQSGAGTDGQRCGMVGWTVHDHEGHCFTAIDREVSSYRGVRVIERGFSIDDDEMGTDGRVQEAFSDGTDPGTESP